MNFEFLDKLGPIGTFIVAASCPGCWPLFIPIGSALGLGFLQPYESIMMNIVFPLFVIVTLISSYIGYRSHRTLYPLVVSTLSVLFIFVGFYGGWHLTLMYIGIFGVLIGSVLGIIAKKHCKITNVEQGLKE